MTQPIEGRFILGGRGRNIWRNRKGFWPLAGARTPLQERAKVARASSCNINVGKPLVFLGFGQRARVDILKIRTDVFRGPTVRFV